MRRKALFMIGLLPALGAATAMAAAPDAMLHGERGVAGQPGWLLLDGHLRPDGAATLDAHGLTGKTDYNIGHADRGVPYSHPVTAQFDGAHGTGKWVSPRICDFTFTKL